jgi:glycerol-3-phosphate O-acyltransferase
MLNSDKKRAWEVIEDRVIKKVLALNGKEYRGNLLDDSLQFFLHDVFDKEIPRLEKRKKKTHLYLHHLRTLKKGVEDKNVDSEQALRQITHLYLKEITGHLNPFLFKVFSWVFPKLFSFIFVRKSIFHMMINAFLHVSIRPFFRFSGKYKQVSELSKKGTIIVAPTHSSNLDSPILGLAFTKMHLPPLIYGAGINLFAHKFFAIFMNQLGAYKVDRLKKNELYKIVLKEYCTYTLEAGYNNLFFPGGTRARSGIIETKLRTGLLSCGLEAYKNNVKSGKADKKIFIIPCTLNYHSVLEAPSLIEDHLKREGDKRFIISDDESSRPNEIFYFLRKSSKFFLHIGDPLDPFGNFVNSEGESLDSEGNVLDISKEALAISGDNDVHRYSTKLAAKIVEDYQRHNIILSTHIVAKVLFDEVSRMFPDKDIYQLVAMDKDKISIDLSLLYDQVASLADELRRKHQEKKIICDEDILTRDITAIIKEGIDVLTHFHWPSAVRKKDDRIIISNFKLLLFYQNKI